MYDSLGTALAARLTRDLARSALPDAPVLAVKERKARAFGRLFARALGRRTGRRCHEAIGVASKHPAARFGFVEVRPLWED